MTPWHVIKIVLRLFKNIPGEPPKRRWGQSPLPVATKRKHPS